MNISYIGRVLRRAPGLLRALRGGDAEGEGPAACKTVRGGGGRSSAAVKDGRDVAGGGGDQVRGFGAKIAIFVQKNYWQSTLNDKLCISFFSRSDSE